MKARLHASLYLQGDLEHEVKAMGALDSNLGVAPLCYPISADCLARLA